MSLDPVSQGANSQDYNQHLDSFAPQIDGDPVEPTVEWKDVDYNGCDDKVTTHSNGSVEVEYYKAVQNPIALTDECVYWKTERQ